MTLLPRRKPRRGGSASAGAPRPVVTVLRTPDELKEALMRASAFDERTAQVLRNRSEHYRSLARELDRTAPLSADLQLRAM